MLIYIVRHGLTEWNKLKKLQGAADVPLAKEGILLAEKTGEALRNVRFDICFTSPLSRAKQTAECVLGKRDVPIIPDKRIQEMSFGEFEGLCCREEGWNIPDPGFRNFFNAPEVYQPPKGGESFEEVRARLNNFLEELYQKEELQDKNVLLSTHGAALCGILSLMKGLPISGYWQQGVHKNCAVSIAEVKDGKIEILQENVTYYQESVQDW